MNSGPARYRAFISYSHRDGKLAQKLHRRLETFSVPRALRGARPDGTRIDARMGAIFRDRELGKSKFGRREILQYLVQLAQVARDRVFRPKPTLR